MQKQRLIGTWTGDAALNPKTVKKKVDMGLRGKQAATDKIDRRLKG